MKLSGLALTGAMIIAGCSNSVTGQVHTPPEGSANISGVWSLTATVTRPVDSGLVRIDTAQLLITQPAQSDQFFGTAPAWIETLSTDSTQHYSSGGATLVGTLNETDSTLSFTATATNGGALLYTFSGSLVTPSRMQGTATNATPENPYPLTGSWTALKAGN